MLLIQAHLQLRFNSKKLIFLNYVGKSTTGILSILYHNLQEMRENGRSIFVCEPRRNVARAIKNRVEQIGQPLGLKKELFGLRYRTAEPNKKAKLNYGTSGK